MEEEAAGIMATRLSSRLPPQIQPSEEGAGVNRRRSPRPRPQIQQSEEDGRVTRCGRGTSPEPAASLPDDDDMLREILLRLPPQPSSLPRASAVCKRWRGLVADPRFLRQFYAHHQKPPILGVFSLGNQWREIVFHPILDPPDRIPAVRISLGRCSDRDDYDMLSCRHGLVLVRDWVREEVVVCDPITGVQRRVAVPPEFRRRGLSGAVLCAAGDQGHVHGSCHSSPIKVVLMSTYNTPTHNRPLACVYTSETDIWGNVISTEATFEVFRRKPAVLVGNCL